MDAGKQLILIGIDPGQEGAMAVTKGSQTVIRDLPMSNRTFLKSQSKCLDVVQFDSMLLEEIGESQPGTTVVFVSEQMQSLGFRTPARVLMGLSEISAALEATIRMFCLYSDRPLFIRKYQPRLWMNWMFPDAEKRKGRDKEAKEESREAALRLFPKNQGDLQRKKDHNRAEAALLSFVCLAELSRLQIDPKLTTFKKLQGVYHRQNSITYEAAFTHIYGAWNSASKRLLDEIRNRSGVQPIVTR